MLATATPNTLNTTALNPAIHPGSIARRVYVYWRAQGLSPADSRDQVASCLIHKQKNPV